ncbi:MAG: hypothetical protein LBM99_02440, partial [Bacillales bacterium]|nr:hypothetical protein [Bacillales bacterium]
MPKFESSFLKKSNIFALEQTKKEYIRIVWFFGVLTGLALCLVVFFVVMQEMRQVNGDLLIWIFASIASVLFLITLFFGFKLFQVIQKQDVIYNKRKIRERVTAQKHFLEVETKKEKKM